MEKIYGKSILKKVVIIGPESTGKSTLASLLAKYYNTQWVPEYARDYIAHLNRPYEEKDLLEIAKGQIKLEDELASKADKLLICDTNLLVIKVWSEHKYGACYQEILGMIKSRDYDMYLLSNIDVPWQDDPQREHPQLREFFMDTYKQELEASGVPWVEIKGEDFFTRKNMAVKAIDGLLARKD